MLPWGHVIPHLRLKKCQELARALLFKGSGHRLILGHCLTSFSQAVRRKNNKMWPFFFFLIEHFNKICNFS